MRNAAPFDPKDRWFWSASAIGIFSVAVNGYSWAWTGSHLNAISFVASILMLGSILWARVAWYRAMAKRREREERMAQASKEVRDG